MKERDLQTKAINFLTKQGWYCFKVADRFRYGTLDLFACRGGVSMWIELKTQDGRISAIQKRELAALNEHGCHAFIARSLDDIERINKDFSKEVRDVS